VPELATGAVVVLTGLTVSTQTLLSEASSVTQIMLVVLALNPIFVEKTISGDVVSEEIVPVVKLKTAPGYHVPPILDHATK